MPTPGGKPKVGERVRWRTTAWRVQQWQWNYGVVTRRSEGTDWSLWIRRDDTGEVILITEAGWYVQQQALEVLVDKVVPAGWEPVGDKIREMLARRERGELKRTADDYISGLVEAYRLFIGAATSDEAMEHLRKNAP